MMNNYDYFEFLETRQDVEAYVRQFTDLNKFQQVNMAIAILLEKKRLGVEV